MSDPLAELARLITTGFGRQWERPRVRQVPYKYFTVAYGPVFAYRAAGYYAECVTWMDVTVNCHHNELLPFDPDAEGADLISTLEDEIGEMRHPHMDDRSYKYQPPRKSRIGAYLFELPHIWQGEVGDA
jgi:hypothetical protein